MPVAVFRARVFVGWPLDFRAQRVVLHGDVLREKGGDSLARELRNSGVLDVLLALLAGSVAFIMFVMTLQAASALRVEGIDLVWKIDG